ncbi:MAG: hypothetical protein IKJ63_01110 [Clostridia bacterium]|nr:hypothetical protein [Clostridia bacterium]
MNQEILLENGKMIKKLNKLFWIRSTVFSLLSLCDCFNNQPIVQYVQKSTIAFMRFVNGEKELLTFYICAFCTNIKVVVCAR